MDKEAFYTLKGYTMMEHGLITSSMEDYLEMSAGCREQSKVCAFFSGSRRCM